MKDQDKNKQQLLEELSLLRHRVSVLEGAEEELRTSRATLQTTIDNLPFDFFAVGMDGRYTMQNATSKAHWGDAVGKLPEDAAGSDENLALWKENNRRAFAGAKVEEEAVLGDRLRGRRSRRSRPRRRPTTRRSRWLRTRRSSCRSARRTSRW